MMAFGHFIRHQSFQENLSARLMSVGITFFGGAELSKAFREWSSRRIGINKRSHWSQKAVANGSACSVTGSALVFLSEVMTGQTPLNAFTNGVHWMPYAFMLGIPFGSFLT